MPVIAPFRALLPPIADSADRSLAPPIEQPAIFSFELELRCEKSRTISGVLAAVDASDPKILRGQAALASEVRDAVQRRRTGEMQSSPVVLLHEAEALRRPPRAGEPLRIDDGCAELRLWPIENSAVEDLAAALRMTPATVAAGHAEYEAALAIGAAPLMAAFVSWNDPGLEVRPVHRVVSGIPKFETGEFIRVARANFFFREVSRMMHRWSPDSSHPVLTEAGPHFDPEIANSLLAPEQVTPPHASNTGLQGPSGGVVAVTAEQAGARVAPGVARNSFVEPGDAVMLAVTRHASYLLHSKPGWADTILTHVTPLERRADVVQLHRIILEKVLKVTENDACEQRHVSFHTDALAAVAEVERGADVAFIMNALPLEQYRDVALSGAVLPPRSLDLLPEFPKGLIAHVLA